MGIRVDFLIKHVRPCDIEAYGMICNDPDGNSLRAWLLNAGVSEESINIAYNSWAALAVLQLDNQTIPQFVAAAQVISQARWAELYHTPFSSIMFLNGPLLKELSYQSAKNAGKSFDFLPAEVIPIVVTIAQVGAPTYRLSVTGAKLAADANGNCCHFEAIIP
jgi:hypothetical protein